MSLPRKAMVLAAGLGTRLRPLTDDRPKALVEVAGRTMLDLTLTRLRAFGVQQAIVNVFHFADRIVDYLRENNNFGMRIEISREETLLDTGGGLKQAAWFFLEAGADKTQPFLLHNVDILSNFDLNAMCRFHTQHQAFATLAVQHRKTSRALIFDEQGQLRRRAADGEDGFAFAGIHMLSPRIFSLMDGQGAFSIIDTYLRLSASGERILGHCDDQAYWRDLGKPESVAKAAADLEAGVLAQWKDADLSTALRSGDNC